MGRPVKSKLLLLGALLFLALPAPPSSAARSFPTVEALVTDIPDVLSDIDEERLTQALEDLKAFNSMPGVIVIAESTDEWDFIEYAHDLFGYLRREGFVDQTGFLIYISTEDIKMAFEVGNDLKRAGVLDEEEIRDIRQRLGAALAEGAYFDGINGALSKLRKLTGASELDDAKRERGNWMMLAGLIILIGVLYMNLARKRRQLREGGQ